MWEEEGGGGGDVLASYRHIDAKKCCFRYDRHLNLSILGTVLEFPFEVYFFIFEILCNIVNLILHIWGHARTKVLSNQSPRNAFIKCLFNLHMIVQHKHRFVHIHAQQSHDCWTFRWNFQLTIHFLNAFSGNWSEDSFVLIYSQIWYI